MNALVTAVTASHRHSFKPKHCAGVVCFHDHHGEPAVWRDRRVAVAS